MTLQCPLGKCQPVPIDAEAIKRDGWRDQGILVVHQEIPGWIGYSARRYGRSATGCMANERDNDEQKRTSTSIGR